MEKKELIAMIAKRANIGMDQAETVINDVIAEMISPQLFRRPGDEVGFINDNNCRNNCKEALAERESLRR